MPTIQGVKITQPEVKQFFQDIEGSGFLRDQVDLIALFNRKPHLYGEKGTAKRKAFRRFFYQLKRISLKTYSKY